MRRLVPGTRIHLADGRRMTVLRIGDDRRRQSRLLAAGARAQGGRLMPRQYEHPSSRRDQVKYAEQVSPDAAERQVAEAKERFYCCGELKLDGHHPFCSQRRDMEQPEHIDGQESLL